MNKRTDIVTQELGFTIIELLIATTVVSVILLLSTVMITNIGNLYYKGVSESQVQDDVRSITDEIAQHLELTPLNRGSSGSEQAYCIGSTRYTYILGQEIGTAAGQSTHVLWRDTIQAGTCLNPMPPLLPDLSMTTPSSGGTELISPRSRLTAFSISPTSPYVLTLNIAFGDDDQLCDSGTSGDCSQTAPSNNIWNPHPPAGPVLCKGSATVSGQQFCGTANLTTTVVQRLP